MVEDVLGNFEHLFGAYRKSSSVAKRLQESVAGLEAYVEDYGAERVAEEDPNAIVEVNAGRERVQGESLKAKANRDAVSKLFEKSLEGIVSGLVTSKRDNILNAVLAMKIPEAIAQRYADFNTKRSDYFKVAEALKSGNIDEEIINKVRNGLEPKIMQEVEAEYNGREIKELIDRKVVSSEDEAKALYQDLINFSVQRRVRTSMSKPNVLREYLSNLEEEMKATLEGEKLNNYVIDLVKNSEPKGQDTFFSLVYDGVPKQG